HIRCAEDVPVQAVFAAAEILVVTRVPLQAIMPVYVRKDAVSRSRHGTRHPKGIRACTPWCEVPDGKDRTRLELSNCTRELCQQFGGDVVGEIGFEEVDELGSLHSHHVCESASGKKLVDGDEEERLVLLDGTAERAAEIVPPIDRGGASKR